jgi:hypothetical protein
MVAAATKIRKPIMMAPAQIKLVESLSKKASNKEKRTVSFAEIVRRAVDAYELSGDDDEELLNSLLDEIIHTTKETVREVKKLNQKLEQSQKREFINERGG